MSLNPYNTYQPSFQDPGNPRRNAGGERRGSYNRDYGAGYGYQDGRETYIKDQGRSYTYKDEQYDMERNRQEILKQQIADKKFRQEQEKIREHYEDERMEEAIAKQRERLREEYNTDFERRRKKEEERTQKLKAHFARLEEAKKRQEEEKKQKVNNARMKGNQSQEKEGVRPEEEKKMEELKLEDKHEKPKTPQFSTKYDHTDTGSEVPVHYEFDGKRRRLPGRRSPSPVKLTPRYQAAVTPSYDSSMKRKNPDSLPPGLGRSRGPYIPSSTQTNHVDISSPPIKETAEIEVQTEWDDIKEEDIEYKKEDEEYKERSPSPPPFDWKIEIKEPDDEARQIIAEMSKDELKRFEDDNPDLMSQIRAIKKDLRSGKESPSPEHDKESRKNTPKSRDGKKTPEWLQSSPNTPETNRSSRNTTARSPVKSRGYERTPPQKTPQRSPSEKSQRTSSGPNSADRSRCSTPDINDSDIWTRPMSDQKQPTPASRRRIRKKESNFDLNATHGTMLKNYLARAQNHEKEGEVESNFDEDRKDSPDYVSSDISSHPNSRAGTNLRPTTNHLAIPNARDNNSSRGSTSNRNPSPVRGRTSKKAVDDMDLDVSDRTLLSNYVKLKKGQRSTRR